MPAVLPGFTTTYPGALCRHPGELWSKQTQGKAATKTRSDRAPRDRAQAFGAHAELLGYVCDFWSAAQRRKEPSLVIPQTTVQSFVVIDRRFMAVTLQHNKFCLCKGASHKSNKVYMVLDFERSAFYQKCHDPDCNNFQSEHWPLPRLRGNATPPLSLGEPEATPASNETRRAAPDVDLHRWASMLQRRCKEQLSGNCSTVSPTSWLLDAHVEALMVRSLLQAWDTLKDPPATSLMAPAQSAMMGQELAEESRDDGEMRAEGALGDGAFDWHRVGSTCIPLNSLGAGGEGHQGIHWSLLVYTCNPWPLEDGAVANVQAVHYDSSASAMNSDRAVGFHKHVQRLIKQGVLMNMVCDGDVQQAECPKQSDGYSCGDFTAFFAYVTMSGFWQQIGNVYFDPKRARQNLLRLVQHLKACPVPSSNLEPRAADVAREGSGISVAERRRQEDDAAKQSVMQRRAREEEELREVAEKLSRAKEVRCGCKLFGQPSAK